MNIKSLFSTPAEDPKLNHWVSTTLHYKEIPIIGQTLRKLLLYRDSHCFVSLSGSTLTRFMLALVFHYSLASQRWKLAENIQKKSCIFLCNLGKVTKKTKKLYFGIILPPRFSKQCCTDCRKGDINFINIPKKKKKKAYTNLLFKSKIDFHEVKFPVQYVNI